MRIFPLIAIAFLIYIETYLFVQVANNVGVLFTLLLAIGTSFVGVSLVKNQGLRTLFQIQQKIASGENPAGEMIKSVCLLLAGLLLLIPGFFTDFLGLLLTLAPVQKLLGARVLPFIRVVPFGQTQSHYQQYNEPTNSNKTSGNVIEGEYKVKDDDK